MQMIENHRIKRGLLRLGEATVSQLSTFADCEPGAVVDFLERSPDIVERGASERWHLRSEGRERIKSELVKLGEMSTPDLREEREQASTRLRDSIRQIRTTLEVLENDPGPDGEEHAFARDRVLRRIHATRKSARKLDRTLAGFDLEVTYLDEAERRLERLVARTESAAGSEAPVADCLALWTAGWATAFEGTPSARDGFVPHRAEAGAVVIVEAAPSLHWMTETMVQAARSANAPIMCLTLNLGDKSVRTNLLERLSGQVATAAGAAARVVFTIDSRRPESLDLVHELMEFERHRSHLRHVPELGECTWRLLDNKLWNAQTHALRERVRTTWKDAKTVEHFLLGALVSHMADEFRSEYPSAPYETRHRWPHLNTICIDVADPTPLTRHLEDTGVVVVGLHQLLRLPGHGVAFVEPLPLTDRVVPSPSQQAWRAAFVPAVDGCDE